MVLSSLKLVLLTQLYENYLRLLEVTVLTELTRELPLCRLMRELCAPLADYSTDCDYSSRLPALSRNRISQL